MICSQYHFSQLLPLYMSLTGASAFTCTEETLLLIAIPSDGRVALLAK